MLFKVGGAFNIGASFLKLPEKLLSERSIKWTVPIFLGTNIDIEKIRVLWKLLKIS